MKNRRHKNNISWFVVFCIAVLLVIIVCNVWSLVNGHCTVGDFLCVPPIGWVLIVANILAGMILYIIKHRKRTESGENFCSACHIDLRDMWTYCPNCGSKRGDSLTTPPSTP
jgi:hypothetical protein